MAAAFQKPSGIGVHVLLICPDAFHYRFVECRSLMRVSSPIGIASLLLLLDGLNMRATNLVGGQLTFD
jgi:hypothetical protein